MEFGGTTSRPVVVFGEADSVMNMVLPYWRFGDLLGRSQVNKGANHSDNNLQKSMVIPCLKDTLRGRSPKPTRQFACVSFLSASWCT